ncbi:hypothetical protein ATANTOWER_006021 [Ataeniobius toweri]|uniref:Uncharacterized protein n=1 Tax=Ataeniobius toweri TaxID=208326 RepID=A0ABU7B5V0_9TELE|nr:hypothetical protein [Ataeniobius toweri]
MGAVAQSLHLLPHVSYNTRHSHVFSSDRDILAPVKSFCYVSRAWAPAKPGLMVPSLSYPNASHHTLHFLWLSIHLANGPTGCGQPVITCTHCGLCMLVAPYILSPILREFSCFVWILLLSLYFG